jgi:hypothetical protein
MHVHTGAGTRVYIMPGNETGTSVCFKAEL